MKTRNILFGLTLVLAQGALFFGSAGAQENFPIPEVVRIPPGEFIMGTEDGDQDERPAHRVRIDYAFAFGKYEVTRGEFAAFVQATGHDMSGTCRFYFDFKAIDDANRSWLAPGYEQEDDHPVVCVNWNDAKAYVTWLSEVTGENWRLPTEAEWEYVAKAEGATRFYWQQDRDACAHANITDLTRALVHYTGVHNFANPDLYASAADQVFICTDGWVWSSPVGRFKPNAFGVYDMLGNAWEWLEDCELGEYGAVPDYTKTPRDGSAYVARGCDRRTMRGGSWHTGPAFSRIENRTSTSIGARGYHMGFRVAKSLN